jgi:hypothetical protein
MLSAGMLAGALMQGAASASVPAALTATTVHAAALFAVGKTASATGVSAAALALTDGMLKTMLLCKLKVAVAALAVVAMVTTSVGGIAYYCINQQQPVAGQVIACESTSSTSETCGPAVIDSADEIADDEDVAPPKQEPNCAPPVTPKPRCAPPMHEDGVRYVKVIIVRSRSSCDVCCPPPTVTTTTASGRTTTVKVQITSPEQSSAVHVDVHRAIKDALGKGNAYVIDLTGGSVRTVIVPALKGTSGVGIFNSEQTERLWVILNNGQCHVFPARPGAGEPMSTAPTNFYSVGPLAP